MKTNYCVLCYLFLFLALPAFGETEKTDRTIITKDGIIYHDVIMVTNRCTPHSIFIKHKSGVSKLKYDELTDTDKIKYGYNPELLKAEEDALAEKERQKAEEKRIKEELKKLHCSPIRV